MLRTSAKKKKKSVQDIFFRVLERYSAAQPVLCSHPYCVTSICIHPFLCIYKCD